jgi:hypothetical protein
MMQVQFKSSIQVSLFGNIVSLAVIYLAVVHLAQIVSIFMEAKMKFEFHFLTVEGCS